MTETSVCPGCGAEFPPLPGSIQGPTQGPTHAYLSASAACWACFNQSMALHYGDRAYWPAHQMLTDAYALQHSQGPDPRARRSAVLHLVALYAQCALELPHERIVPLRRAIAAQRIETELRPWPRARLSIRDVVTGDGPQAHLDSVRAFGKGVAADWQAHHAFADALCRQVLAV